MTNSPPPIIIVSGLPRSGTSMMMKMLEAGGLPLLTDGQRTADEDNPKGYYEFERVKKLKDGDFDWLPSAQGKAVKVISALLESLPQGYSFQVIFMRRLIPEILASQRKMLVNRGENPDKVSDDEMARLFEKHLAHVDAWIASQPHLQRLDVDYNLVIRDPLPAIVQVNRFLGGRLDESAMAGVIDPSLYRQRKP
jgi:hypothetical protein